MSSLATRFASSRNLEWFIHSAVWILFLAEKWINHYSSPDYPFLFACYNTLGFTICFLLPLYINALVLLPKYLQKSKWIQFVVLLLALLLFSNVLRGIMTAVYLQLEGHVIDFTAEFLKWGFRDFSSLTKFIVSPTALILLFSFAYRLIKDWFLHERIKSALVTEKVAMELAFLKAQVDPHFLFNTLNNIYALALEENAARTADGVAKMGTLMRYSLHDSQAEQISLEKEVAYIEKYIELQKLRIAEGAMVQIGTDLEMPGAENVKIAPMMLLPFIENAFKYGISTVAPSSITVALRLEGGWLRLLVKNSLHHKKEVAQGGIGLKNVQNRLRLLYPERHQLQCTKTANEYTVHLEVRL